MKVIVAIDSFKGSASSEELNEAVKTGIFSANAEIKVETFEIADGGEGTISALKNGLDGELITVETVDLLQRHMVAKYLFVNKTAFIESAEVVGIDKIVPTVETIQKADTFGLGALFIDAKNRGASEIILSLGGTGTSDGGIGLLKALETVDFTGIKLLALSDVINIYAGETGYAKVFGKQKGGTVEILESQDLQARKFCQKMKLERGIDLQAIPGTGAAGGLGAAIVLLGGKIESGFTKIAEMLQIEEQIKEADLVITGEGRMDFQTENGKVPFGMAKLSRKHQVPIVAFCGSLGDDLGHMADLLAGAYSIQRGPISIEKALENEMTLKNIEKLAFNITKTYFH